MAATATTPLFEDLNPASLRKRAAECIVRSDRLSSRVIAYSHQVTKGEKHIVEKSDRAGTGELLDGFAKVRVRIGGRYVNALAAPDYVPNPEVLKNDETIISWDEATLLPMIEMHDIHTASLCSHNKERRREAAPRFCQEYLQSITHLLGSLDSVCEDKWERILAKDSQDRLCAALAPMRTELLAISNRIARELARPSSEMSGEELSDSYQTVLRMAYYFASATTRAYEERPKPWQNNRKKFCEELEKHCRHAKQRNGAMEWPRVLFLDRDLNYIANEPEPKDAVQRALELSASYLVLLQEYPAGKTTPSRVEVSATLEIYRKAQAAGIDLLDHFVLTESGYYSFALHNYIQPPATPAPWQKCWLFSPAMMH